MSFVKIAATTAILAFVGFAAPAQAGCLKGAIVGGLAGKLVGHGYAGAAAGCAYGAHKSNQAARQSDVQSGRSASVPR